MEMNEILEKLPKHLLSLVIDQPYNQYTAQDHAVWRYVMKQNLRYLPGVAHHSYLDGLDRTGVSIDEIPHMYGMNRILKEIGWAAVAVDGFIPPSAFMEFQAYNVLVIAADIRPIDQIEYTPAPDIIHEAAGHAPIIADPQYAEYLKLFGKIGSRAFSSVKDYQIYEAIRHLSILKADPNTPEKIITKAENVLTLLQGSHNVFSEMALIRNLHWWTVEYGLIGDLKNPKIYGAGLLSSIGESFSALQSDVKKIPYSIDAVNYGFDITTRQPQLFVTPDFETLTSVLNEFADRMAMRKGGMYALQKALDSGATATIVFRSGLQVCGTVSGYHEKGGEAFYLSTAGPSSLCYHDKQLEGHGKDYHSKGFGSPIGKLKNTFTPLEDFRDNDLKRNGIEELKDIKIEFESGVVLEGRLLRVIRKTGKIILMSFDNCTVRYQDKILFEPGWGVYDMAVGSEIISGFSGPADPNAFGLSYEAPKEKTHKIIHSAKSKKLQGFYQEVRDCRSNGLDLPVLNKLYKKAKKDFPDEWLIQLEILELVKEKNSFSNEVEENLLQLKNTKPELSLLIENGFKAI